MTRRTRKFTGGVIMLAFVCLYAMIAMALAASRPLQEAPSWVRSVGYIVLGLAWVLPIMPLIRWMERVDGKDATASIRIHPPAPVPQRERRPGK